MGNGPILTENTTEIAVGKEDGPGSILAHQRNFLAKVGLGAGNHRSGRSSAKPCFPSLPIHPTAPGAEVAVFKNGVGLLNPLGKFSLSFQFHIGRLPPLSLSLPGVKRKRRKQ